MTRYKEIRIYRDFLKTTRNEKGMYTMVFDDEVLEHPIDLPAVNDRIRGIVPAEFKALDDVCEEFGGLKLWYNPQTGDGKYQDGVASSYLLDTSVVTHALFFDDLEIGAGRLSTIVLSNAKHEPSRVFLDALVKAYNDNIMDFAQLVSPFEGRLELIAKDRIYLARPGGPIPKVTIAYRNGERKEARIA